MVEEVFKLVGRAGGICRKTYSARYGVVLLERETRLKLELRKTSK